MKLLEDKQLIYFNPYKHSIGKKSEKNLTIYIYSIIATNFNEISKA